jgi:hypothetical protein
LNAALSRVDFITKRGKQGHRLYIQKHAAHTVATTSTALPDDLTNKLRTTFNTEIADLNHNFGVSGTCSAFLLRKILEKLIYLAFMKNGQGGKLQDPAGKLVGLQTMLTLAVTIKVRGKPFMTQKTADAIRPVKFLGDTAAHNPLANVSMKTVEREMAYIITAYSELATVL